jgi:hypothetical protein
VAEGIRASVGATERALGDGARAAFFAAFGAVALPSTDAVALEAARVPPAAAVPAPFAPTAAHPAVSMTALSSTAAVVGAPDHRALRRLPFRPNITSILPACIGSRTGDRRRRRQITHFGFRIFRYRRLRVVSPSCDANPIGDRPGRSDGDRRAAWRPAGS